MKIPMSEDRFEPITRGEFDALVARVSVLEMHQDRMVEIGDPLFNENGTPWKPSDDPG